MQFGVSGAVLVPPTGNGVGKLISAVYGGESSSEQAVPDDGALFSIASLWGPGDHFPL